MKIEQIYTGCIAQAAYYLESNGEAAIFDPLREVQPYLDIDISKYLHIYDQKVLSNLLSLLLKYSYC